MAGDGPNIPFIPAFTPFIMPVEPFDRVLNATGIRLNWLRAHGCPCVYDETQNQSVYGTPDPACRTCGGHGWYWDPPGPVPFTGLITFASRTPTPHEPGIMINEKWGDIAHGEPVLTIPQGAGDVWGQASTNDAFVEVDGSSYFDTNLQVGGIQAVPYQQGLSIAPTGAVTVYDSINHEAVAVSGYTVSGAAVTLPASYPTGTGYNVKFNANPVWVALAPAGGLPHNRPFGGAPGGLKLPRRFKLQTLDLWVRARSPGDPNTPQGQPVRLPGT